jgi:hypothetical protein
MRRDDVPMATNQFPDHGCGPRQEVMVLGGILCMFIIYYLSLVDQQNILSARSQGWNMAIAVSEAGIEEGLQELNIYCLTNGSPHASDGWVANGPVYWGTNTIPPDGDWYSVSLDLTTPTSPAITSRAYVNLPALAAAPSSSFFAAVGVGSGTAAMLSRAVQVTCSRPTNLFSAAMIAKHAIDLKGNGVLSDSFDSSNPAKSTNGKYDSSKYTGDYGDVATDDSIIVGVQNANIYGKLHTGPTGGYSMGPQGGVGTHAWQTANGGGMQPGYFLQDANFTFPDTTLPNTNGYMTPQPGDIAVTFYPVTSNSTTTASLPTPLPWGPITSNTVGYTTISAYPSPVPPGLVTNTTWVNNSTTLPSPVPAGTISNATAHSSSSLPSPIPVDLTTNTSSSKSKDYPAVGTYVPPVTYDGHWYYYNAISGYSWNTYTYNYPTYTYTYPNFTYTYYLYHTNAPITVTNHYDNVLYANTKYAASALNGQSIVLGPNVTLVLPNGLSGAENITWNYNDNNNPGLTVYSGGSSVSISGNQYINPCGFAGSLIVYCAPTVTSFTLNGNGQFTGVLVAPNANLAMHGGGNSDEDFCGSLMVNSVGMNGHFHFHWDEALGHMASANSRYLINSWNEIP